MKFSIIICTRNPRPDYFGQMLRAVQAQTLPREHWEVVVVDSASEPAVASRDLPFPLCTRFVRVSEPGVFRARMAGVRAAAGEWVVFADDDNVLDPVYLETGLQVVAEKPHLDIFCGRISGEFETTPEKWIQPYLVNLAVIDFNDDTCSRERDFKKIPTWSAGMFIRRSVAQAYFDFAQRDPRRLGIRNRCEDVDMILYSIAQGSHVGKVRCLHLRHLISRDRLTLEHLLKVSRENAFNMAVLGRLYRAPTTIDKLRAARNLLLSIFAGWSNRGKIARTAAFAYFWGLCKGRGQASGIAQR